MTYVILDSCAYIIFVERVRHEVHDASDILQIGIYLEIRYSTSSFFHLLWKSTRKLDHMEMSTLQMV